MSRIAMISMSSISSMTSIQSMILSPSSSSIFLPNLTDADYNTKIMSPYDILEEKDNDICITCNTIFNVKYKNKYCSYICYKKNHLIDNEFYKIKCRKCKNQFLTKCIFTDYCSDECFKDITNKYHEFSYSKSI